LLLLCWFLLPLSRFFGLNKGSANHQVLPSMRMIMMMMGIGNRRWIAPSFFQLHERGEWAKKSGRDSGLGNQGSYLPCADLTLAKQCQCRVNDKVLGWSGQVTMDVGLGVWIY